MFEVTSFLGEWTYQALFIWLGIGILAFICSTDRAKKWWETHICGECEHPPECFECDRSSCEGCEILYKK
jgi:hypothetical protein